MKPFRFIFSLLGAMAGLSLTWAFAEDAPPPGPESAALAEPRATASSPAVTTPDVERAPATSETMRGSRWKRGQHDRDITKWGHEAVLKAGEEADNVVALFGPVTAEGEVHGNAVSVFGPVFLGQLGTSGGNVVAVLGNARVEGVVEGNVVAVLGTVELGPKARVKGNVVSVGASIQADPDAIVSGDLVEAGTFAGLPELKGLQAWVQHALLLGRPLALHRDVLWAWGVAGVFLMLYLFIALVMNRALVRCAETLEERPGKTVLAAFLAVLLAPLLLIVLSITVVGAPLLVLALGVVSLIGKAAFLCWFGRRVTLALGLRHAFPAVVVGGVLLALLYLVPFLGFAMMKATDLLGVGMVVYTLILAGRRDKTVTGTTTTTNGSRQSGPMVVAANFERAKDPVPPVPPPPLVTPVAPLDSPGASIAFTAAPSFTQQQIQPNAVLPNPAARIPQIPLTSAMPRAGFGIRLGALLIDGMLVFAFGLITLNGPRLLLPIMAVYLSVLWALKGTTVGGIICGLKIVRLDDRPLDWTTAIVRALAGFVSVLPAGLGFLWIAFDDEKQAWHDKVAGTIVVHAPKGMSLV